MKTAIFGFAVLVFGIMLLSSPYWVFREFTRPNDEPLPEWMGDPRARKKRLAVIVGVLALIAGGVVIAAGLSEQ